MNEQDHSYKLLFSHPQMVTDLLRGFVHEEWVSQIDFSTLEPFPTEHITDCLRERRDDIIWRVKWRGSWLFIYLLLEFQSSVESYMAVRIMTYIGLLYQDIIRAGLVGAGGKLPPVFPIVLYNGSEKRWDAATNIRDLIEAGPKGLEVYCPWVPYLILDEGGIAESELTDLHNCVTALIRLEKSRTADEIIGLIKALKVWLTKPEQTSLRRAFTLWIGRVVLKDRIPDDHVVRLDDLEEVDRMLAETVKKWPDQWKAEGKIEGKIEGKAEGKAEGKIELLAKQIQLKFGKEISVAFLAQAHRLSSEQIDLLSGRILSATSAATFFEGMGIETR